MAKRNRYSNKKIADFPSETDNSSEANGMGATAGPDAAADGLAAGISGSSAAEFAAFDSLSSQSGPAAEMPSIDDATVADPHRRKRRRNRQEGGPAEGVLAEAAGKPLDAPVEELGALAGYKAYGEPLTAEERDDGFDELKAMEELLSNGGECGALPLPEVFNAYPPEVQRKIMEWADRDVKARRDDESRRKDELVRASIERERRRQSLPAIIIVVAVLCGAVLGFVTKNPLFSVMFLIVPIAVIVAVFVTNETSGNRGERYRMPPK